MSAFGKYFSGKALEIKSWLDLLKEKITWKKTQEVSDESSHRLWDILGGKGIQKPHLWAKPLPLPKPLPMPKDYGRDKWASWARDELIAAVAWAPIAPDETPQRNYQTQTQAQKSVSLDLLDLSRVIDIYAESQAVQAFDTEMGRERNGVFQKVKGFFARSFQRMGRDAWIGTEKRKMVEKIKAGLRTGEYTEESLRTHVIEGTEAISTEAHLRHEQTQEEESIPPMIQQAIDTWIATPVWAERRQKLLELKSVIEASYPTVTVDLSQLESSLMRLQEAKIWSELQNIDMKLKIFDIGGIEQGNGQRKEGLLVKTADKIANSVNNSKILPQWVKEKLIGVVRHPNTAAVLSALGTRWVVSLAAGGAALGFTGGLLVPVAVGSVGGGLFAAVRARREMRDRIAEIDRRWARGEMTGSQAYDGKSSNVSHQTNTWQHPAVDLYNRVLRVKEWDERSREDALIAWLSYLVKHRIGRERSINMLQYDTGVSVSRQHVAMIQLMNQVFPGLVARFNSGALIDTPDESHESQIARELYENIRKLATDTMNTRISEEKKYARTQGLIFWGTAFAVGGTVWVAIHGIVSWLNGYYDTTGTWGTTTTTSYPGNLQAQNNLHRGFWYDNTTPAPRFDHTELMIQTDKAGWWNVSHMLGKTATTITHGNHTVSAADFTSGKIQAVITPKADGPSFLLPIDAKGNIQIPQSMQDAFNKRSFAYLEVGEVEVSAGWKVDLSPIATVKWSGAMNFVPTIINTPGTESEFIWWDAPWWWVPWGINRYHELGKSEKKQPQWKEWDKSVNPVTPGIIPPITIPSDTSNERNPEDDPAGLFDDTLESDTSLRDREKTVKGLWAEIVEIRKDRDARKGGLRYDPSKYSHLSDSELITKEAELLKEHQKKYQELDKERQSIKNTELPETEKKTYTERITSLMDRGILAHRDRKPLFHSWYGRVIVAIRTKNGEIIPFYRSMNGTSGKEASKWYPCFGITDDAGWLIKGTLNGLTRAHGVKELKELQNTLNTEFDWDPSLDNDFVWNAHRNPLVIAGGVNTDFTKEEEKKQKSIKPEHHGDGRAEAWIVEWVSRVAGIRIQDPVKAQQPSWDKATMRNQQTDKTKASGNEDTEEVTAIQKSYDAASRFLSIYSPVDDSVLNAPNSLLNGSGGPLEGEAHRAKMLHLLEDAKKWGDTSMRAISAFYAKNGKIWLSERATGGHNSTNIGNIVVWLNSSNAEWSASYFSRRLYEISWANPIPEYPTIVLFHELGHQLTKKARYAAADGDSNINSIINEVQELRDEQWAGITPLSSMPFYRDRYRSNPNWNTQFWEDMAELMGLYLMGREYVERYLDDRIRMRRDMKANISEWLKGRIMDMLDSAYSSYVA